MSSLTYSEKMQDPRWIAKAARIKERDGFRCRDCRKHKRNLEAHHCHYESGNPWETDDSLLLTLCGECHEIRQSYENAGRLALGLLFANTTSAGARMIAEELASRASVDCPPVEDDEWLRERRWLEYAERFPQHREYVEMVLGRKITWGGGDA